MAFRVLAPRSLSAVLLLAGLMAGQVPARAQAPAPAPAVVVAKAELRDLTRQSDFVGRIKAVDRVDLRARVEGFLKERRFTEGQDVKAGDVLFVIEREKFEADVDTAKANLEKAKAVVVNTALQLGRARELVQRQNIAQATVDQRAAEDASARADVLAAEAELQRAELNLSYTIVTAPVSGRIGQASVTPGNLVNSSTGVLATIVSQDPIFVTFPVSARQFAEAQRRTENVIEKIVVRVLLADGSPYAETGRIEFIDVQTNQATDTVLLRAKLPNPKRTLIEGQTVRVMLEGETPERALMIPQAALQLDQTGPFVMIVDAEKKAQIRRIKLGPSREGYLAVADGLKAGDLVIVQGVQRVRPGMPVTPTEAPASGS